MVGNRIVDLNASVAMDMICVRQAFTMGSPTTEAGGNDVRNIMSRLPWVLPRQIRSNAGSVRSGDDRVTGDRMPRPATGTAT